MVVFLAKIHGAFELSRIESYDKSYENEVRRPVIPEPLLQPPLSRLFMTNQNNEPDWARTAIQESGLRVTMARIATLEVLNTASMPLTHAEVYQALQGRGFDKATVFRNLSDLVSVGLLRRSELGDHVWRFELIAKGEHPDAHHPHFVCVDCGTVSCLHEIELTRKSKSMSDQIGKVTEILLRGHCHECA